MVAESDKRRLPPPTPAQQAVLDRIRVQRERLRARRSAARQESAIVRGRSQVDPAAPLAQLVADDDFAVAAYRLSLLGLLGDPAADAREGPLAELARLPLYLELSGELETLDRGGVGQISAGRLAPLLQAVDAPPARARRARKENTDE